MTSTDPLDLDAIEARANAATPGPWRDADTHLGRHGHTATVLSGTGNDTDLRAWLPSLSQEAWDETRNVWADAAFIAAARTDVPLLLAEVRRLRTELAASRSNALTAGADAIDDMERRNAWPVRPVDAGICSEFLRGMAAGSQPDEPDTLPAWLYSRFNESLDAPAWDRLSDDDRTYWEHQARAVRRAVARGGFKADPTPPAVVPAR